MPGPYVGSTSNSGAPSATCRPTGRVESGDGPGDLVAVAAHGPEGLAQTSRVRPAAALARRTR
jgi:hypothetical protein